MPQEVIGSWIPRTRLHLQEFYKFLQGDNLLLDEKTAKKYRRSLQLDKVVYHDEVLDYVEAKNKEVTVRFTQDGIVYMLGKDAKTITPYFEKKLLPALSYLFSKGASVPKLAEDHDKKKIKTKTIGKKGVTSLELYEYLLFNEEYEAALHAALHVHRVVWDEISEIRNREKIKYKDLPKVRNVLLETKESISFFKSRITQMRSFIEERRGANPKILKQLAKKGHDEFESLKQTQNYMQTLLVMTEEYADTTLQMVRMIYQENEQKELNTLQIIFTMGVAVSFITLGTMSGAKIILNSGSGEEVIGRLASFEVLTAFKFGLVALLSAFVVYFVLHFLFKGAKQFRIINLVKVKSKSKEVAKLNKQVE